MQVMWRMNELKASELAEKDWEFILPLVIPFHDEKTVDIMRHLYISGIIKGVKYQKEDKDDKHKGG